MWVPRFQSGPLTAASLVVGAAERAEELGLTVDWGPADWGEDESAWESDPLVPGWESAADPSRRSSARRIRSAGWWKGCTPDTLYA
jgi:hypothetical protein